MIDFVVSTVRSLGKTDEINIFKGHCMLKRFNDIHWLPNDYTNHIIYIHRHNAEQ